MESQSYWQHSIPDYLKTQLSSMSPAYFGFAMATGIVAISSYLHGLNEIAFALSWINIIIYPILLILFLLRILFFPKNVIEDISSHLKAPGFFSIVAATSILGSQLAILHQLTFFVKILWWMTVILWAFCTYVIFTSLTIKSQKPTLENGLNGGWLIAVVATQSVTVLGCVLGATILEDKNTSLFILTTFWLLGGMLYLWIIGLIFYRYMFFPLAPSDLVPPYWINMGAVAISTLAGVLLSNQIKNSALLGHLYPFIQGLTIMFWATATWWIPMLIFLGIWRHHFKGISLTYDPLYWGLVFPFGMYSACSLQLSKSLELYFLISISKTFIIIAACVWLLTFLGLFRRIIYTPLFIRQGFHKLSTPINVLKK